MAAKSYRIEIEGCDCSPLKTLTQKQEKWIRELAQQADTGRLTVLLGGGSKRMNEPLVSFDAASGTWWTGRYIGEVQFDGGSLRITPRFGDLQLSRWLSRIWGIELVRIEGEISRSRLWIWRLVAHLWQASLVAAAKHGIPTRRVDESHVGLSVRGRLDVRGTTAMMVAGRNRLVSRTRERRIDQPIAEIIVAAHQHLLRQIGGGLSAGRLFSAQADDLLTRLGAFVGRGSVCQSSMQARKIAAKIRYTPITESYRGAVDLSLSILAGHGIASTAVGQRQVTGAIVDMAEVWELYLYHLIRTGIPNVRIQHTARKPENEAYLFHSNGRQQPLGGLKPDLMAHDRRSDRLIGILDAKYKRTTPSIDRPSGVVREDLYQINAYLSAFGGESVVSAALVYPAPSETLLALQDANPYSCVSETGRLHFLGIEADAEEANGQAWSPAEIAFLDRIGQMFGLR